MLKGIGGRPFLTDATGVSLSHAPVYDMRLIVNIDGRPGFATLSISDVQQVEIAAIDPDFDRGQGICP